MDRASSGWTRAAATLLSAAAAFHLYRAWALPITTDEAFTFNRFVGVRWLDLLRSYDANHHVLHSVLCKLSTGLFGPSEFSLRLPAVIGGWLALLAAYRISRRLWGDGPAVVASCAWMAGLPQIAEYFSLARGYSLALAFWLVALLLSLDDEKPRLALLGAFLGLSVAANLVFLVPCAALAAVIFFRSPSVQTVTVIGAPSLAVMAWFLIVPLQYASKENYYFGAKNWAESIHSLLIYTELKWISAAILFAAVFVAASRRLLQVLASSLAFLGVLYVFRDVPLPYERTGIYLLAMLGLLAGGASRVRKRAELPAALVLAAIACWAASHLSPYQSTVWTFDAYNRDAMRAIVSRGHHTPQVAAAFPLEHGIEFYRRAWRLRWPAIEQYRPGIEADYLLWRTDEGNPPLPEGFVAINKDARSGVILAKKRDR